MWKLLSFSEIKIPLKPYLTEYSLGIVENQSGKRKIAQIDKSFKKKFLGMKGTIKIINGPQGKINLFSLPEKELKINNKTVKINKISRVGIIGTGKMGCQLAQMFSLAGLKIILKSRKRTALNILIPNCDKQLQNNILITTNFKDLKKADLIIEAVSENEKIKITLFKKIETVVGKSVILATNTSSLSINHMAAKLNYPGRFIGIHFFNPIKKMPLVEIIKGEGSFLSTIASTLELIERLGKTSIIVKDGPGFIVNRLLFSLINEAAYLLEEKVANVNQIDQAMKLGANHPMGPFELADFIGIDLSYEIIKNLSTQIPDFRLPAPIFSRMIKAGKMGIKTKAGFYNY